MDCSEILRIISMLLGTVLWFVGPIFARETGPPRFLTDNSPSYQFVARDARLSAISDIIQCLGASLVVLGITPGHLDISIYITTFGITLCFLWTVRTLFYYYRWVAQESSGNKGRLVRNLWFCTSLFIHPWSRKLSSTIRKDTK